MLRSREKNNNDWIPKNLTNWTFENKYSISASLVDVFVLRWILHIESRHGNAKDYINENHPWFGECCKIMSYTALVAVWGMVGIVSIGFLRALLH